MYTTVLGQEWVFVGACMAPKDLSPRRGQSRAVSYSVQPIVSLTHTHTLPPLHTHRPFAELAPRTKPGHAAQAHKTRHAYAQLGCTRTDYLSCSLFHRPFAELYAGDEAAFFRDYAAAHARLSELGVEWVAGGPISLDDEPLPELVTE